MSDERVLVLGGGGIAGLGWLAGLLLGLIEGGADLRDADRMIGTSAGAATAAQLRSTQSVETLYARQSDPALIADEPMPARAALVALAAAYPVIIAQTDPAARAAAIGDLARVTDTVTPQARRAMIERRLADHAWPDAPLTVTAVDLTSGTLVAFDAASGVGLIDAVAASCAVPGAWPVVEIAGRRFVDGGMYSADNAHLASGAARVIVASPQSGGPLFAAGQRLADHVALLERIGSRVMTICPDEAALLAMGANPLSPKARVPSARAGRAQGRALATSVAAFWT